MTRITINLERCTGCRSCEIACSYHFNKTFDPEISSIEVVRDENGEIRICIDSSCDLCESEEEPLCVKFCRANALEVDNK